MKSLSWLVFLLAPILAFSQPVHDSVRVVFLSESNFKMWLALNHYKTTSRGYKSEIQDSTFFTSKRGSTQPRKEFNEFVNIIRQSKSPDYTNTVNKFPARSYFVMNMLGLTNDAIRIKASSRIEKNLSKTEVSFVYASVSFRGLSSALGHAFLRTYDPKCDDSVESIAIYYSANSGNDGGLNLIFKGLTGGYNGKVSKASYLSYIKQYLDKENRDLHEYKIASSVENLVLFYLHIEEISSINIRYKFLDGNCVSQLVPLVNILINGKYFNPDTLFLEAPSDILLMMEKELILQRHRITSSRYTLICDSYQQLNEKDKTTIRDSEKCDAPDACGISFSEDVKRLYLLYKSYQYDNMEMTDERFINSINKLGSVSAAESIAENYRTPSFPEFKYITSINIGYATDFERSYYDFGFNPVSIQSVNSVGLLPIGSDLSISNVEFRFDCYNLNLSLQRIDCISILNIPKQCDLIHRDAWGVYLGGDKRIDSFGNSSFLWRVGAKYGKSFLLTDNFVAYGLVAFNSLISQRHLDRTDVETGFEMGININKTKFINTKLNIEVGRGHLAEYNFVRGNAIFQRDIGNQTAIGVQYSFLSYFGKSVAGNDISLYIKRFF